MKKCFSTAKADRFVNPYNFVPLVGECRRSRPTTRMEDCYTGYFDCQIKLLTPLFIPNTSSELRLVKKSEKKVGDSKRDLHKGYDFFSYDDWSSSVNRGEQLPEPPQNPVIPGSEIRGAVRSVHEAAFHGCLSSVSADRALSRRSAEAKIPGILKKTQKGWQIQKCERAMLFVKREQSKDDSVKMGRPVPLEEYDKWCEGQELWFKLRKEPFTKTIKGRINKIGYVVEQYQIIEGSSLSNFSKAKENQRKQLEAKQYQQGWLHKGEAFKGKHHESIFYLSKPSYQRPIEDVSASDKKALTKNLEAYRDPGKNRLLQVKGKWYTDFDICEQGTLVYYSKAMDGHVYLSPACIGREVFDQTVGELLKLNGGYEPCDSQCLCPSCQVFGMVGKAKNPADKAYAYGSKVRVSDAVLIDPGVDSQSLFEAPLVLPELGEPKPGAVEFYTKSPYTAAEKPAKGQGYWTYDYKCKTSSGQLKKDRVPLEANQPELRGRKFYWHSKVDLNEYRRDELSAMRQRIRPLKASSGGDRPQFGFRVYFEHLSKEQLNQLKWSLDFGDSNCAHKIGRAKPLGFGSVQIIVESLRVRKIDLQMGTWELKDLKLDEFFSELIPEHEALKTVRIMADWKKRPLHVKYPSVEIKSEEIKSEERKDNDNSTASHQWFAANKENPFKPNFCKVLPNAKEDACHDLGQQKALYQLVEKK